MAGLRHARLRIYEEMLMDPTVLWNHRWPHTMELLERARENGCITGLATMSHREALRVLEVLGLTEHFAFVATQDDVEHPKPDPEIYRLVAAELEVATAECLVIEEDSPSGVQAARAAGMDVIAVTTPFTRQAFRKEELLDRRWVVDEPAALPSTVRECLIAHQRQTHGG